MTTTRVGSKHQITIPREAYDRLGLKPGDVLEVEVRDGVPCAVPLQLVPRDQAWFWTPEWQQMEREADAAIANGEVSGPFDSVDELLKHLHIRGA